MIKWTAKSTFSHNNVARYPCLTHWHAYALLVPFAGELQLRIRDTFRVYIGFIDVRQTLPGR